MLMPPVRPRLLTVFPLQVAASFHRSVLAFSVLFVLLHLACCSCALELLAKAPRVRHYVIPEIWFAQYYFIWFIISLLCGLRYLKEDVMISGDYNFHSDDPLPGIKRKLNDCSKDVETIQLANQPAPTRRRTLTLRDASNDEIKLSIYGRRASELDATEILAISQEEPVVAIFVGLLVKPLREIRSFVASLDDVSQPVVHIPAGMNPEAARQPLPEPEMKELAELAAMSPYDFPLPESMIIHLGILLLATDAGKSLFQKEMGLGVLLVIALHQLEI
ncbi:hypothetical protein EJB05_16077, partial [Eragrostis curvula]